MDTNLFTLIPKVDDLLNLEKIDRLIDDIPRKIVIESIREELDSLRLSIKNNEYSLNELESYLKILPDQLEKNIMIKNKPSLIRTINATGVVIHTNLGRSLLSEEIVRNIEEVVTNYSNLEYDLESGRRGSRYSHLENSIVKVTGGEAAMVVNNNAAAVMLALSTMAKGKETIVSRGELIEIGGSFRIPDVMEESGTKLIDVGTTNKTHLRDYERAIGEETGALLKVHTSNYRILGFTSSVESSELLSLKQKYDLPLIEDLGSGVLIDLSKYGLEKEPTVQESLNNGVDIVTFSGDKLLGGPQAGIIVGKKEYIEAMKENPLTRAFRVDKFTISALETTFRYYLNEEDAINNIPTLKMLTLPIQEIERKAITLKNNLEDLNSFIDVSIENDYSEVGGGSLPLEEIPTKVVVISSEEIKVSSIESKLRGYTIPIITRVYKDRIYIDLRTVKDEEIDIVSDGIHSAVENLKERY